MSLERIPYPSPNYSSRSGAAVRLIVLHTAEGASTIAELGGFFADPAAGVSSHVGIDDTPGTVGEYVRPDGKAWTAADANPVAVQAELCAWAEWGSDEWNQHPVMLANTAAWIAEEADRFGIPIVKLSAAQAQGTGRGVCQHNDLGSWGGGHWDCGPQFPIDHVLNMALGGAAPVPSPPPGPGPAPPTDLEGENVTSYYVDRQHHVYAQRDDGTVDHWWQDEAVKPPTWRHETLPKAA